MNNPTATMKWSKEGSANGPPRRRDMLRDALPASLGRLRRRLAADIPAGFIEDYVALNWLRWNAGALQVTDEGERVCDEVVAAASP